MSVVDAARELVELQPRHRVVSVYLDLGPERFATAPARASQIRSLVDEARREVDADEALGHEEKTALREDLQRIDAYLSSREAPFRGARSLAVFSSVRDGLFEALQVPHPVEARVVIDRRPYVAPLLDRAEQRRWCVVLVSRRDARVLVGPADRLEDGSRLTDDVHGQHDQGGWSQANYERSIEKDTDDHLRRVADAVRHRARQDRFDRLVVGGPPEIVPRFERLLGDELRARIVERRFQVDLSSATDDQIRAAVAKLAEEDDKHVERDALDRLAAGIASGGRAVGGVDGTLEALAERRVHTLLLEPAFDRRGYRCPACGLLVAEAPGACPADGAGLEEVEHLREATVEAALEQDAEVMVVRHYPDLGPFQGLGALLRF